VTSVDRTAYPRFPRVVSGRELAEAFTPSDGEVDWARGRTQDAGHLLALVVWLKSYQRLGCFPKLAEVPGAVAGHVRGVLGLPDRVGLEQATERSAKRHRQFVRDRLEVVYEPARVRQVAEHAIRQPGHRHRRRRSHLVRHEPQPRQRAQLDGKPKPITRAPATTRVDERDISASQREVPDQVVLADVRERPQLIQLIMREQARRHRHHPNAEPGKRLEP
jgi:hypothetical protein